jgi:hypothetical protein
MQMHVVGITDSGKLSGSELTPASFSAVGDHRVACFVVADPTEVNLLQSRVGSTLNAFLLVNDEGLTELHTLDPNVVPLGRVSSAV